MVLLLRSPVLGLRVYTTPPALLLHSSSTRSLVTMSSALPSLDMLLGSLFGGYEAEWP